jgi:hypothetical protein
MTKLEKASGEYAAAICAESSYWVASAADFQAGARWALEQMKSKRVIDVGEGVVDAVWWSDVAAILAAVRKEIEG